MYYELLGGGKYQKWALKVMLTLQIMHIHTLRNICKLPHIWTLDAFENGFFIPQNDNTFYLLLERELDNFTKNDLDSWVCQNLLQKMYHPPIQMAHLSLYA